MSLVDQTILASDPKREGNCLSACVATLLDIPLGHVPHFIEVGAALNGEDDQVAWWAMFLGFMAGKGQWPVELASVHAADEDEPVFVMGMSPRGVCHQVIYVNGELWHDPHPSHAGLVDVREVLRFEVARFDHTPTVSGSREESAAASAAPIHNNPSPESRIL